MSLLATLAWIKNHAKTLYNVILALLLASSIGYGTIAHNKAQRLSEELKIANNNIEAYQDALQGSQQASGVLQLDMTKLQEQNDRLVQQIDSVRKLKGIKAGALLTGATQAQICRVTKAKGVGGDIITLLKDTTYNDSIQYNDLTKVHYTIGKDSVRVKIDLQNTQYLYIYKHKEYLNKKNFFQRLFTFDWKKKYTYKYEIHNTNDLLKEDSVRVIESIQ